MPGWIAFLIPYALKLIAQYGLPYVEARWPALAPIIEEILKIIGGKTMPSAPLMSAACHYNEKCAIPRE